MKNLLRWFVVAALATSFGLAGCSGDNGTNGKSAYEIAVENGFTGTEQEWLDSLKADPNDPTVAAANVEPESCATCHNGAVVRSGASHQAAYNQLFQQGVVQVTNVTYANDGTNDTVTFQMTKNGSNFDCTQLADATVGSLSIGYSQYTAGATAGEGTFTSIDTSSPADGTIDLLSLKGTITYDAGTNTCTSVKAQTSMGDLAALNGVVAVYGEDELVTTEPEGSHLQLAKYPFGSLLIEGTVDYSSTANVTGCEKCHQVPYYKHGYIIGDVGTGTATAGVLDFYTCKVCHVDNRDGGHLSWQYSVDNPQGWAADPNAANLTAAQIARYAYKTRLMNDVHMSHAMEFPYPMSMRNCATCHEGKLDRVLTAANFTIETCKSCHPITGGTDTADASGNFAVDTRGMALETIWTNAGVLSLHEDASGNITTTACSACHTGAAGAPPAFNQIHTGYNPLIYDSAGDKYADGITVSFDSVTLTGNVLDIKFSATGSVGGLNAADIVPTVLVSFYGYNTKDFLVSNHTRDANGLRMEKTIGTANALFTEVATGVPGSWEVTLDFGAYAQTPTIPDMIAAGTIKRAEIAVTPALANADGDTVGLNAPSKTFDLTAGAFEDNYFSGTNALVEVMTGTANVKGCNSCHDQLATTFHNGSRGGNIVVCRMCHVVTSGGSHLEGQSRSIDSYVHAIHSFQAFNIDSIDFTDPVEAAKYEEHISFLFPDFATINCQACHTTSRAIDNGGRVPYDVPDQSMSMPGVLSATDEIAGMNIPATPAVVTGPAARACGGCHRAEAIKEDEANEYASFNRHTTDFGYRIENTDDVLNTVIARIMSMFQ